MWTKDKVHYFRDQNVASLSANGSGGYFARPGEGERAIVNVDRKLCTHALLEKGEMRKAEMLVLPAKLYSMLSTVIVITAALLLINVLRH